MTEIKVKGQLFLMRKRSSIGQLLQTQYPMFLQHRQTGANKLGNNKRWTYQTHRRWLWGIDPHYQAIPLTLTTFKSFHTLNTFSLLRGGNRHGIVINYFKLVSISNTGNTFEKYLSQPCCLLAFLLFLLPRFPVDVYILILNLLCALRTPVVLISMVNESLLVPLIVPIFINQLIVPQQTNYLIFFDKPVKSINRQNRLIGKSVNRVVSFWSELRIICSTTAFKLNSFILRIAYNQGQILPRFIQTYS